MIINLIGPTAVGKSTIGQKVAKELEYEFIDFDIHLEKFLNKELHELYKIYSYDELMKIAVEELVKLNKTNDNLIIATGAAIGKEEILKDRTIFKEVYYLEISLKLFTERIKEAKANPELKENKNRTIIYKPDLEIPKKYDEQIVMKKNASEVFKVRRNNMDNIHFEICEAIKEKGKDRSLELTNNRF